MNRWRAFLQTREPNLRELMDDPDCDPVRLDRTYAQFRSINRFFSGWRRIYTREIRPLAATHHPLTLLDIGCGGGDIPRALAEWAERDGINLRILGIDPDPRALAFFQRAKLPPNVTSRDCTTADLVAANERFDVVISNHVLHHLADPDLEALLRDCRRLARHRIIHSDLRRSRFAYAAFGLLRPLYRNSFIIPDGLRSIRRSFHPEELRARFPDWEVEARPFGHQILHHVIQEDA